MSHAQSDLIRAGFYAAQALAAETKINAKFFHGLARYYWARANASES